jgi:hypothetical protein
VWSFENRIGALGAQAHFDCLNAQLLGQGYLVVDATLVLARKQYVSRDERSLIDEGAIPADWEPAKRRQKDADATWTKEHG